MLQAIGINSLSNLAAFGVESLNSATILVQIELSDEVGCEKQLQDEVLFAGLRVYFMWVFPVGLWLWWRLEHPPSDNFRVVL
jgi:hypothetical protein